LRNRPRIRDSPWLVFPLEYPGALGCSRSASVLRDPPGVPDPGDRRADRRKHRRPVGHLLLALDLAPRLDAVGLARTRRDDLLELGDVELEAELLATGEPGDAGGDRGARRAARQRAGLTRDQAQLRRRILDEAGEVLGLGERHAELPGLGDEAGQREQPDRILDDR